MIRPHHTLGEPIGIAAEGAHESFMNLPRARS